jgi:hypothetical protein
MSQDAWPTPREPSREPLPRVDDLPVAEQGYEQESVRAAFDSFYRHAAQLDAALRTLEAVDSFHRQAAALRADIRALRGAGWSQQPWSATPAYGYASRAPREGVSPAVWRIAGEAAFLIAVAVGLGVAKVAWWVIVLVMAFAWLLVGMLEWSATRDRFALARAAPQPQHPVVDAPPAPERTEEEAHGWTAFEEAQEPSDAMTMIGAPPSVEEPVVVEDDAAPEPEPERESEPEPEPEPAQPEAVQSEEPVASAAAPEPEPEPEVEPEHRRRWWQRSRSDEDERVEPQAAEPPRHVRVLPPDPWEEGPEQLEEPDEETGEDLADETGRRLFRRR